jgi:hypothetical protein
MSGIEVTNVRTSRLAKAAIVGLWAVLAGFVALMLTSALGGKGILLAGQVAAGALIIGGLAAAPVLGVAAMIVIARSDGRLSGAGQAVMAVVMTVAVLGFASVIAGLGVSMGMSYQMLCGTNMKGIGNAMLVYAGDNDGRLPDAGQWCDLLVTKADVSPSSFRCKATDAIKGESSYAMNIAAAGRKLSELPPDMVVLFEVRLDENEARTFPTTSRGFAKDPNSAGMARNLPEKVCESRWNQVCGPERIDVKSHERGCNVLCADMHVEFANTKRLPSLKWSLSPDFVFPAVIGIVPDPKPDPAWRSAVIVCMAAIAVAVTLLSMWRYRGKARWTYAVTIAALSGGAGWLLGLMSQILYQLPQDSYAGGIAGLAAGVLAGLAYAPFIAATSARIRRDSDVQLYAVAVGMIAGVICSSAVHGVLMIVSRQAQDGFPMLVGLPYGALAGAFLGGISAMFLRGSDRHASDAFLEGG